LLKGTTVYTEVVAQALTERGSMPDPQPYHAAERLPLTLTEGGLQRMAARVLSALLFTEAPAVPMGQLAEQLGVSVAAVSGAIRNS
jgi:hypothetical protein